jgi:hypothetical protein
VGVVVLLQVVLLQVVLLRAVLLWVALLQVDPILRVDLLLLVVPIWGMHPLGILLLVVLFQVDFCLVLVGLLCIMYFDPIEIFRLGVLRLVDPVDLINLLDIELHHLL